MANSVTTSFSHTYNGREFLTELFYKPQEGGQDVFGIYKIMQVVDKTNLYIPGNLSKILRKYTTCGFSQVGSLAISDRTISTAKVKVNLEECEDAFDGTVFEEAIKQGVEIDDLRGTVVEDILRTSLLKALGSDIPRICWFGVDGASSSDYDQFDGWVHLIGDVSGSVGQYLDMNTDANIESGGAMVADGAITLFRSMYENQSKTLRAVDRSGKKFYVTSTIMDNYLTTLEDTQNERGQLSLEDGTTVVKFRGIEVVEVKGWDTALADTDNPNKAGIGANMCVFTTPDNLIVGCDVLSPANEVKVWFSEDDEVLRMKSKFKLGTQILHPELISFAY
jgi:hypothetical protein